MSKLVISKKNEVFLKIESEPHVYQELADHFCITIHTDEDSPIPC